MQKYSGARIDALASHPEFDPASEPLDNLLDRVQRGTIAYFREGAHPVSGLAHDRRLKAGKPANDLVSVGGTGFAVLAIIVGVFRGWIARKKALGQLDLMLDYLEKAQRFHGAFSHFLNGSTTQTVPFSRFDDGGDLMETSLLVQGLICAREFFRETSDAETALRTRIDAICNAVEWSWYTGHEQQTLFWHWSPNFGWRMNMPIAGWNEGLVAYVLAAGSNDHRIDPAVFRHGWRRDGAFLNQREYYGYQLPAGPAFGGPLFFAHYSFCTLDPWMLKDPDFDYHDQVIAHARINHQHCVLNPGGYAGYSAACWGLTSSHGPAGYLVSSPTNDTGIIAPTAALSSFPYLPAESEAALRFFFSHASGALWGRYGFVDAFSPGQKWMARTYLAINQGPIVAMIENHRSGLLWRLFMNAPEVQRGLSRLGLLHSPARSQQRPLSSP